ncbi:VWA domain-containing protein [Roseibium sp.]|uniref:VWA domain-containing protein n=1 Tax=Roseibium sp. TaxID=1936156 RepID=UPI003A96E648
MIELSFPWAVILLPVPLLLWAFLPPHREKVTALRSPFFAKVAEAAGADPRPGSVILSRLRIQTLAALVVWTALVIALARPERVGEPIEIEKAARDVMLAIDISGSMDERDFIGKDGVRQQRLDAVKQVVGEFIEARDGDRIGLIIFGSKAFVQSPLTEDLATVRELLDQTEVGMAGPHTVIGDAIGLSIRTFQASDIEQRLLILLSDGADTGSRMTPVNAAEIAAANGVEIFSVAVGDAEASGDMRVDVATLEDIAARANGVFFHANDEAALAAIYARIDEMKPRAVETLSFRPREPLGYIFLLIAGVTGLAVLSGLHLRRSRKVAA